MTTDPTTASINDNLIASKANIKEETHKHNDTIVACIEAKRSFGGSVTCFKTNDLYMD